MISRLSKLLSGRSSRLLGPVLGLGVAGLAALPAAGQCTGFTMSQSSGAAITPGVTDIGNHCDDCATAITLPFGVTIYGVVYTTVNATSNGVLTFTTANAAFSNDCLPQVATIGVAICPHWDDLRTDGTGEGIFTAVTGTAPNRVFSIEWRSHYYSGAGTANFEVNFFEDQSHFDMVYGVVSGLGAGATIGAEHTLYPSTQFSCNFPSLSTGLKLTFACTNSPIPPIGTGAATPTSVYACGAGQTSLLTVNVTPGANPVSTGTAVQADLSSIGGSASQVFYNDGTHGDVTANDSTFSFAAPVLASVAPGVKTLLVTVSDAQGRSSNNSITMTVNPCPTRGPDVFVGNLIDMTNYGSAGNITAYSVGTDACNNGDLPVTWLASVNQHPVIAQNMFRLKNGRFEQIGQSWLKHGFSSTNSGSCATCQQPPQGSQQLGVSCSDAYGSGLNGSQGNLGPRSQVNATTAVYPYPYTAPTAPATIGRRLQVYTSDVDPAANAGASYFVECHYVTSDDAQWSNSGAPATNGLNNATYRPITIADTVSAPAFSGGSVRMSPGIQAWKDVDPSVAISNADYVDTSLIPGGIVARFVVAAKVTDNGNGTWHYEYAVYNHNADRAGGSFSVPRYPGAVITNVGFHGVFAHSGEPYPNTAANPDNWAGVVSPTAVTWTAPEAYLPPNGDNGNAIRWGTMYNFRFDANVPPRTAAVTVGLYKPGAQGSVTASGIPVAGPSPCLADIVAVGGLPPADGIVTGDDFNAFINAFAAGSSLADIVSVGGLPPPDGIVTGDDFNAFINSFAAGCP